MQYNARALIGELELTIDDYMKAAYHTFAWFIGAINHFGYWNTTRKASK